MSATILLALSAAAGGSAVKDAGEIVCTEHTIPVSRFTRRECTTRARAAARSRNAETAWRSMQNATGPTSSESDPKISLPGVL